MVNKSLVARVRNKGRWNGRGSEWSTPVELFEELDEEFCFTLDVCASEWNRKCERYFSVEEDGLTQEWGEEVCFMNPPYGKALNDWMKKAYASVIGGATVVCLVPAATDLGWWHDYAMRGEIRFLRGRPRFLTESGKWQNTFLSSVIVIFVPGKVNIDE